MLRQALMMILFSHLCACFWILLGRQDFHLPEEQQQSWLLIASNNFPQPYYDNKYHVYVFAYYWVMSTITTVGYGDYTGSTSPELLFSIFLEFSGMCLFAIISAPIVRFLTAGNTIRDKTEKQNT